jgi:hypothetical protein
MTEDELEELLDRVPPDWKFAVRHGNANKIKNVNA